MVNVGLFKAKENVAFVGGQQAFVVAPGLNHLGIAD